MTRKLKHTKTEISGSSEHYEILINFVPVLEDWNYFTTFNEAESYLLKNYTKNDRKVVGIARRLLSTMYFIYS